MPYPVKTINAITATLAGGIAAAIITALSLTTLSVSGLATLTGGAKIGAGTTIKHSYSASSSRDFAAINAGACSTTAVTVTGATTDDSLAWSLPASVTGLTSTTAKAWVSAASTVSLKVCNYGTSATADPAAGVVRVTAFKYY
jgi:hypothetical protein